MEQKILEGFERFAMKGRSFKPKVTIRARGQIGFNNGSVVKFGIEKYDYIVLFYSKEKNQIAMKLTNDKNENGAIKLIKKPGNYCFSGRAFLDFYDIGYDKANIFDVEGMDDNIILISLKKTLTKQP